MNAYGIEPVAQRPDGCFAAVVSMLTGIDYEVLPNVTATFGQAIRNRDRIVIVDRAYGADVWDAREAGLDVICAPWEDLKKHYEYNYGIKLAVHRSQPNKPAGRIVNDGDHIVVHLPDGCYINPDTPTPMSHYNILNNLWITAEVIN